MKKAFDKVIEQLEEEKKGYSELASEQFRQRNGRLAYVYKKKELAINYAIEIVNQVEEECKDKYVSIGAYKQVAWERDIAIKQLNDLGYGFGQEIEEEYCEWKWGIGCAYVQCKGDPILFDSVRLFTYCPYCGKKIKVVE